MSDYSQGPGWWQASDGKWYPPQPQPMPPPPAPPYPSQPYPAYQPQPVRKMNGLAIAALVCGILWGFGVLAILAVIFGLIALKQIKARDDSGRGLAIAGVILGGIGILGAIATVILLVSVSDELDEFTKPATVRIEADDDVCWSVTIEAFEDDLDGTQQGCGDARLPLGGGFGRSATVTNETGPGGVEVAVTVDGEVRDRETADELETVTVEP